jgi:UDP-2-acetamido-3-amino-2,3-dideoxy-glucuronate N-acetyltransferase
MPAQIHPSSIIDVGAQIGDRTRIWHFCHLMSRCRVGEDCNIGQNVFIDNGVNIGDRVKIQNNVSVYNGVTIEDDVFIGPSVVFTNVINPRSFVERKHEFQPTQVGRGATIGANATILCGVSIAPFTMVGAGSVVVRNTKAYELIIGNPGHPAGWISEKGYKLLFDNDGKAWCAEEATAYELTDGVVVKL